MRPAAAPAVMSSILQPITGLRAQVLSMHAETNEASDWLHRHVSNVDDIPAGGHPSSGGAGMAGE